MYEPLANRPYVDPTNPEVLIQVLMTVVTNFVCVPLSYRAFKEKDYFHGLVGGATALFSALYHLGDTLSAKILWMTPGNWHRLDNVFSIFTFAALNIYLMDIESPATNDLLRWSFLIITLYCQEKSPWDVLMTILPILGWLAALIISYLVRRRKPRFNKNVYYALGMLAIGFVFFGRGLDEDKDYLRLNHGLWHMFSGLSFFFWFRCLDKPVKKTDHIA